MHTESGAFALPAEHMLKKVHSATLNTPWEGRLYLVGGIVRDYLMHLPHPADTDLVVEGDAGELAQMLYEKGIAVYRPVIYARFGTALLQVSDSEGELHALELVSARAESYQPHSRKPQVQPSKLKEDAFRRDFTINTLMQNLHTGELLDLTGQGMQDLQQGVLRTPLDPKITFFDDPLRMLRAIRFAARFNFTIETSTWQGILLWAQRLNSSAISPERIRDEFFRMALLPGAGFRRSMELLRTSGLMHQFLPEMEPMAGCLQGGLHLYDVWEHTLTALQALADESSLPLRLGLLWHDIAKPVCKTEENGMVRFTKHAEKGAEMVKTIARRLRFSNDITGRTICLVALHMKPGQYKPEWTDGAVRKLIREAAEALPDLLELVRCDQSAMKPVPGMMESRMELLNRIQKLEEESAAAKLTSPLNGNEIMALLGLRPGPELGRAKDFLTDEVVEGRLKPEDHAGAEALLREWYRVSYLIQEDTEP